MAEDLNGIVTHFNGIDFSERFSAHYATRQAEYLAGVMLRHGVHPGFVDITKQHIADTIVVVDSQGDVVDEAQTKPLLDIRKVPETIEKRRSTSRAKPESYWQRMLIVNNALIRTRSELIYDSAERLKLPKSNDKTDYAVSAVDWMFAESSVAMLGASCHMQRYFGTYVSDYNGSNYKNKTYLDISTEFLQRQQAQGVEDLSDPENDFESLSLGFGLLALHDILIARDVVRTSSAASWITGAIKESMPTAFSAGSVDAHFKVLEYDPDSARKFSDGMFKRES